MGVRGRRVRRCTHRRGRGGLPPRREGAAPAQRHTSRDLDRDPPRAGLLGSCSTRVGGGGSASRAVQGNAGAPPSPVFANELDELARGAWVSVLAA
eukprot:scaffold183818_cov25-Tisochrysis_lutea.AAC.2